MPYEKSRTTNGARMLIQKRMNVPRATACGEIMIEHDTRSTLAGPICACTMHTPSPAVKQQQASVTVGPRVKTSKHGRLITYWHHGVSQSLRVIACISGAAGVDHVPRVLRSYV